MRGAPRGGATGVGVEGSPGPEPRDGDADERLRHMTINHGVGGCGLARCGVRRGEGFAAERGFIRLG